MMSTADVCEVLDLLEGAELDVWVDGGWGVDALLQEVSRPHSDLDLVVRLDQLQSVRDILTGAGFGHIVRDWLPVALALADDTGRQIDVHPVTRTPDGGGDQAQLSGDSFHYPPPVSGMVGRRAVRCVDVMTQVSCHVGYQPTDKDRTDLRQLQHRFGLELPEPYL